MNSLSIRQSRSNSATFTGLRPITRRAESPRPIPITIRPFEITCIVAYVVSGRKGIYHSQRHALDSRR